MIKGLGEGHHIARQALIWHAFTSNKEHYVPLLVVETDEDQLEEAARQLEQQQLSMEAGDYEEEEIEEDGEEYEEEYDKEYKEEYEEEYDFNEELGLDSKEQEAV